MLSVIKCLRRKVGIMTSKSHCGKLFPWQLVFMVERYGVTGVGGRAIGWRAGLLVRDHHHPTSA
jgi:hypothetical protein